MIELNGRTHKLEPCYCGRPHGGKPVNVVRSGRRYGWAHPACVESRNSNLAP